MKLRTIIALLFLLTAIGAHSANGERLHVKGIVVEPHDGEIEKGTTLDFTFPVAMVPDDQIDAENASLPFVAKPALDGKLRWKSATECTFEIADVIPGAHYRLTLLPALKSANGDLVAPKNWAVNYDAPELAVSSDWSSGKHLSALPKIQIDTNYPVNLAEAAQHIYFEDREGKQRYPIEVVERADEKNLETQHFYVQPREKLPVNHTFDLVVNGVVDAKYQRPLPYLKAIAAGATRVLTVKWVGAYNLVLDKPAIHIEFNDLISPDQATPENIHIEPAVRHLKLIAEENAVMAQGDFDLSQHYQVTISPSLLGKSAYGLAATSKWGATFHPKSPCIVFPDSTVYERSQLGLRFAFLQVRTGEARWRLARIPLQKLSVVQKRLTEFEENRIDPLTGKTMKDPRTGFVLSKKTELLTDAFALPVFANGKIEASRSDAEVMRRIDWTAPANGERLSGPYLLEIDAPCGDGRVVGNRAILFFSEAILTQKRSAEHDWIRVAKMSDDAALAGVLVRAVTTENVELAHAKTDRNGIAMFDSEKLHPKKQPNVAYFIAETPVGLACQSTGISSYDSGYFSTRNTTKKTGKVYRSEIVCDRNLYRPGETVKWVGYVREALGERLSVPRGLKLHWQIRESNEHLDAEGDSTVSPDGAWTAEWKTPKESKLGGYSMSVAISDVKEPFYKADGFFQIEEYRVPLFFVEAEAKDEIGATAHVQVRSHYFHGSPNAGARLHWKAHWWVANDQVGDQFYDNRFSEIGAVSDNEDEKTVEGDATLDRNGVVNLQCDSPFANNPDMPRSRVTWEAAITSQEGQTISAGCDELLQRAKAIPGVAVSENIGKQRGVCAKINAIDLKDQPVAGIEVKADCYFVQTKTAKEQIAPFVFRYVNRNEFTKVATQTATTPAQLIFLTTKPGRYVVTVREKSSPTSWLASDDAILSGDEIAELPVENETSLTLKHEDRAFRVGEKIEISTEAPVHGLAWVSVESNTILDTFLVPIRGNAGRIELPAKSAYAPNAFVSVYLVQPGGANRLPVERFGYTKIKVEDPARALVLKAHLEKSEVRPGDPVRGEFAVSESGKPVAGADVTLFAVDDAVLKLGEWQMPDLLATFYPSRSFGVQSFASLGDYVMSFTRASLYRKGFVIGDGGDGAAANMKNVRKEFRTLAFWKSGLKSDAHGVVHFEFPAPDNLTTYRIVALAETKRSQFGEADTTVKIAKPLMIDLALPRFVRAGDEVELRAVVRENYADSDVVTLRCTVSANGDLLQPEPQTQTALRNIPKVFRFKTKIQRVANGETLRVHFDVVSKSNPEQRDAVEVTLPVLPAGIVYHDAVSGKLSTPDFNAQSAMPHEWLAGHGKYDALISSSPWLPKLVGLPTLLDYPHGCFEQISSKMLGYSLLGDLLDYFPNPEQRARDYHDVVNMGLNAYEGSLLENGLLPYWPDGDAPNFFVTVQAAWSALEVEKTGVELPEHLKTKLLEALKKIANHQVPCDAFARCFALMVVSGQQNKAGGYAADLQDLYLHREGLSDESRAMLALAMHRWKLMPAETEQLCDEIVWPVPYRDFNRKTFSSFGRAEAVIAYALDEIQPKVWTQTRRNQVRGELLKLMDSSASLSTQENLWSLLAFDSMLKHENAQPVSGAGFDAQFSKNHRTAAWLGRSLTANLLLNNLQPTPLTYYLRANYTTDVIDTDRVDHGIRVERVLRNLTDAKRDGSAKSPLKLGDQVLVTYRLFTQKEQSYVALEDALPAALETVNPDLASVGKFYEIPVEKAARVLDLSHSERRDATTLLYFNDVPPGFTTYSVLARVTVAGRFHWPPTQVAPMYDSRINGLSPSSLCEVSGE